MVQVRPYACDGVVRCWCYEHRAIIGSETLPRKVIWYSILSRVLVLRNSGILKGSSSDASHIVIKTPRASTHEVQCRLGSLCVRGSSR